MKPTRKIPKVETRHAVAVKLAAEFGVAKETAYQWFDAGCPANFEEGKAWKLMRLEEAKIRSHGHNTPCKYEKARSEASRANKEPLWELMSPEFQNLCDMVCDLYLVGITTRGINDRLGVSEEVIHRIITQHPRTKDKDKEIAGNSWADIRRLAQSEIRERLRDPEQRKLIKAGDLNFLAGTAHDKLEKAEAPQQVAINIRARIEAMSHDQIIKMIKGERDVVDAEFEKEGDEMSVEERGEQIKPAAQSQQQGLLEAQTDSDAVSHSK